MLVTTKKKPNNIYLLCPNQKRAIIHSSKICERYYKEAGSNMQNIVAMTVNYKFRTNWLPVVEFAHFRKLIIGEKSTRQIENCFAILLDTRYSTLFVIIDFRF